MYIMQLTDTDGRKVYVNLARVMYFRDEDDAGYSRCRLFMEGERMLLVRENANEITRMIEMHNMRS